MGLVDAVLSGDLRQEAVAFARATLTRPLPQPISARPVTSPDATWWEKQSQAIAARAKGEVAPLRALDCLRVAAERLFAEALAHERATFLELRGSDQAAALRYIFFAERAAPRPAHLAEMKPRPIRSAAVIGGGTMGASFAAVLSAADLPVTLIERDAEGVERARAHLGAIFGGMVKRGRLTEAQAQSRLDGITATTDYSLLADTDLVIEAVVEDLTVKRAVFAELDRICRPDATLATNTSYLDPRRIFEGLSRPDRCIGLHFFNPAQVMKLLEIVPTPATSPETLATAFALGRLLGKIPVQAGICDGFIGNRILQRYRRDAELLVRQGVPIAAIDAAMRAHGLAMGPFEAQDLAGLDIAFLHREAARAAGRDVPETLDDILVRAGRKGQKSGGGWYDYAPGDRTPRPSPAVAGLLAGHVGAAADMPTAEIAARLTGVMATEGRAILDEGIALRASDIDLVLVHGYGYPRWRGGPMFEAERKVQRPA
jgi:3-hydroxyacyl-CoA dehydrogenase